jgi:hypothetical protein
MALRATHRDESRGGAGGAGLQTRAGPPGPASGLGAGERPAWTPAADLEVCPTSASCSST